MYEINETLFAYGINLSEVCILIEIYTSVRPSVYVIFGVNIVLVAKMQLAAYKFGKHIGNSFVHLVIENTPIIQSDNVSKLSKAKTKKTSLFFSLLINYITDTMIKPSTCIL